MAWQFEKVLRTNSAQNSAYRATSGTTAVRTNLCSNPSFGTDTAKWGTWVGVGGTMASSIQRQTGTDTPRGASGFGRWVWATPPTSGGGVTFGQTVVTPSTYYTYSVFVRPSATITMFMQAQFYSSADTSAPTVLTSGQSIVCPAGQWTRVSLAGSQSDAAAASVQVRCYINGAGLISGSTIDVDDLLIEQTDTILPYFDGSSKLNLCPTPSGASSNNGAINPIFVDPLSHTGTLGSRRSEVVSGANILSTYGNGGTGSGATTPATPGVAYTFSAWFRVQCSAETFAQVNLNFKKSDGTTSAFYSPRIIIPAGSTGWYQAVVTATSPDLATFVYGGALSSRTVGNAVVGDVAWVTDNLLEAGTSTPGPFYQGQGLTPAWSSTVNASASVLNGAVPLVSPTVPPYGGPTVGWATGYNSYSALLKVAQTGNTLLWYSQSTYNVPVNVGEFWSAKYEMRMVPNTAAGALTISCYNTLCTATGTVGNAATASVTLPTDGSWVTVDLACTSAVLPNTTNIRNYAYWKGGSAPGGVMLEIRNIVVEKVSGLGVSAGSYFDGATPNTTQPLVNYRFTGVVDQSMSEQYLPQQVLPVASDSRSAQVGYQGTYTVDGIDIQNFAFGISKVAHAVPELRGSHTTLPGRSGVMARANRSYDAAELALSMWIVGCEPDGSVPGTYTQRYALFKRNLTALLQLFGAQNGTSTLTWTPADPAMPSLVTRIIANGVSTLDTMMARQRAELTASMTVVDAFWKSRVPVTEATPVSATLPQNLALANTGSAPVEDAIITITGPVAIPRVTCQASGTWVQYNGNLAANKKLIIDSGAGTATIDGVSVMSQITHGGHPLLMYIPPRNAGIDSISPMSMAPNMQLSGSGGASSTTFSVTYNSKFLVGI